MEQHEAGRVIEISKPPPLAPIHKISPEILLKIFPFLCEENWLEPLGMCPSLTLSAVCGTWRIIMLSHSKLWSAIAIDFSLVDHMSRKYLPYLRRTIQLFMDRSKPTLLSLTLYIGDERESPEIQDIWNTVLASNSNRWRSLHLGIFNDRDSDTIELHPLFQAITGRLESLQHLSITAIPVEVELEPRDLFSVCPSLNSIALECVDLDTLALPHSQIRSLTIRYGAIDDDFATLFPNVEHIVLEDLYCPYDPSDPERQICCSSKVRSLTVTAGRSCEEADEIFNPFRTFTLPGLSSLGITDSASDFLEDWKTFDEKTVEHFLIRSRCSITHFLLKSTPITDGQAIKVIGLMPTLQSLHIEEYHCQTGGFLGNRIITASFLKALSIDPEVREGEDPLAPHLSELTLVLHAWRLDAQALVEALSSRRSRDSACAVTMKPTTDGLSSVDIVLIEPILFVLCPKDKEVASEIIRRLDDARLKLNGRNFSMRIRRTM